MTSTPADQTARLVLGWWVSARRRGRSPTDSTRGIGAEGTRSRIATRTARRTFHLADLLRRLRRLRGAVAWFAAVALLAFGLPAAFGISWSVVAPVVMALRWTSVSVLVAVWFLGLYLHSFLVTAAAPGLTRRRAITVHVAGSAVAGVVPCGGAAALEVHRRMLRSWGVGGDRFVGYWLVINLWGVGCKLLLPVVAVATLVASEERVTPQLDAAAVASGAGFALLAAAGTAVVASRRWAVLIGDAVEATVRLLLRLVGRREEPNVAGVLVDVRRHCRILVSDGWVRLSAGIVGYAAAQCLFLGVCLHLTRAGSTIPEVVAGFAVERMVTILPITPGGVGVGDLGLVTVLLTFGASPTGVVAAALLYRSFVLAVEVPAGVCALALWLLRRRVPPGLSTLRDRGAWIPASLGALRLFRAPQVRGTGRRVDRCRLSLALRGHDDSGDSHAHSHGAAWAPRVPHVPRGPRQRSPAIPPDPAGVVMLMPERGTRPHKLGCSACATPQPGLVAPDHVGRQTAPSSPTPGPPGTSTSHLPGWSAGAADLPRVGLSREPGPRT